MISKKRFSVLPLLLALSMLVAACGPSPEPAVVEETTPQEITPGETTAPTAEPASPSEEPSTLRIGILGSGEWSGVNPLTGFSWGPRTLIQERLIRLKTLTSVQPGVAESWTTNDDNTVWTFKIREGVKFHDGTPCTAEDVAWSLNFMMENVFPASDTYVGNFQEVKALDLTTLQITTKTPDPAVATGKLIGAWILPRSVWEGMSYDEATAFNDMKALIGVGPYKVVDYAQGEFLVLEAFEDYWEGKPAIDRVIFQIYANSDAMVEAIVNGEVDLIDPVSGQAVKRLQEADNNVEVVFLPVLMTWYLMLNSYENGTQPKSLLDPVVRKAIEYATDRQQIINVGFLGYGEPATIPAPPSFGDLHNPNIEALPFDIEEGNRILDEAGYLDSDGNGIREWSDGTPLEYRMYTDEGATGIRMLEVVAEGLAEIGISGTPQEVDDINSLYPNYDYDLAIWNWSWDPDIDESLRSYTCGQVPDGWNDCGWCNPEYDALYEQQKDPKLSHEERREIIYEMQEMFYEGRCYVCWFYPQGIQAYRSDRFTGFVTDTFDSLWDEMSLLNARPVE